MTLHEARAKLKEMFPDDTVSADASLWYCKDQDCDKTMYAATVRCGAAPYQQKFRAAAYSLGVVLSHLRACKRAQRDEPVEV